MIDDPLIEDLARLAREDDVTADPRWDALADGTATPFELAELRRLARQSSAASVAYEAFHPIDEARLAERVLRELSEREGEDPSREGEGADVVTLWPAAREESNEEPGAPPSLPHAGPNVPGNVWPGVLLGDRYRITFQLGAGSMGEVWAAIDEHTGHNVALKVILRPTRELRQRLLREARVCAELSHENIVKLLDVGETDEGEPFLVTELLHGETLAELLKLRRRLSPALAASIVRDIASALSAAHAAGIIHRDIKPANIFLHRKPGMGDEEFVVKVLDFGACKDLGLADSNPTVSGSIIGSLAYMSPEQKGPAKELDHRTDIFSLGLVLYEMLAGLRPVSNLMEVADRRSHRVPRVSSSFRNVPPELDEIVASCLEPDVGHRMHSAAELYRALASCAEMPQPKPAPLRLLPAPAVVQAHASTTTSSGVTTTGAGVMVRAAMSKEVAMDTTLGGAASASSVREGESDTLPRGRRERERIATLVGVGVAAAAALVLLVAGYAPKRGPSEGESPVRPAAEVQAVPTVSGIEPFIAPVPMLTAEPWEPVPSATAPAKATSTTPPTATSFVPTLPPCGATRWTNCTPSARATSVPAREPARRQRLFGE